MKLIFSTERVQNISHVLNLQGIRTYTGHKILSIEK